MSDQEKLVSEFAEITGADIERAEFYLNSSNWNLEVALSCFYDTNMSVDPAPVSENESEESGPVTVSEPTQPPPKAQKVSKSRLGTMAGLRSMESDNEERQAFYTGGSEHSGQQVLGPDRHSSDESPSTNEFLARLLQEVQDRGGAPEEHSHRPHQSVFTGVGYRLGQTVDDSTTVGAGRGESSKNCRQVTLKLWREGFSVDDGPLREYTDPANIEFLERIRQERIPDELLSETRGGSIELEMKDHRHKSYIPPERKVKAFSGAGHLLGSPTPTFVCEDIARNENASGREKEESAEFKVDESKPTTNIQVKLADGSRLQVTLNSTHTIRDLRKCIAKARPHYANIRYSLLTAYPTKELSNDDSTVEEAGILGSLILQRIK